MTTPRLIAVDLDGTLLDPRGQAHAHDVRALRTAIDAGVRVSIVTGRLYSGTRPTAELLGLRGPVACADGSHVVRVDSHTTLFHLGVGGAEALRLRDALARAGVITFVFAQDAIGHDGAGAQFVEYATTWSKDLRGVADVFEHPLWSTEGGVTAVIALAPLDRLAPALEEIARDLSSAAVVAKFPVRRHTHTGTWAAIIRAAGATKGTALRWIAEHQGVSLAETVCVGDWINDVPMFELAGRSFVMGQAPDDVKAKATDILAETVENGGGVARALEEAFGITPKGGAAA